jgi:hypothetical protein
LGEFVLKQTPFTVPTRLQLHSKFKSAMQPNTYSEREYFLGTSGIKLVPFALFLLNCSFCYWTTQHMMLLMCNVVAFAHAMSCMIRVYL